MSRGPGAKGAPRKRQKRNENEEQKRKKEEKKRKNETFQIPGRDPTRFIPISLSIDDIKYKNQTFVIITQSLKYKRNNEELGPHVFVFSLYDIYNFWGSYV